MNRIVIFIAAAALFITALLPAHDLYIRSIPFQGTPPRTVQLQMMIADWFPGEKDVWLGPKTISFVVSAPDGVHEMSDTSNEDTSNEDPSLLLEEAGTYVVAWEGTPSYVQLPAKQFDEYLEREGHSNVLEAHRKVDPQKAGRERFQRHIKTFVQMGSRMTENALKPLGLKLEIIPLKNPYEVKLNESFSVKVLLEGKPLAKHKVMATHETFSKKSDEYAQSGYTNVDGVASFKIDHAGIWMIRTTEMEPLTGDFQADWQSLWSNCVFEVR